MNPDAKKLSADLDQITANIDAMGLAREAAGPARTAGDPGFYIDAGRNELIQIRAAQEKLLQVTIDNGEGEAAIMGKINAAEAEQRAATDAMNAYVNFAPGGEIDTAEVLRHRDAVFVAGQKIAAGRALHSRQLTARSGAVASTRWPKLRERLESTRRHSGSIEQTLRNSDNISPESVARDVAIKHALTATGPLDVALMLLSEPAIIAAAEAANEALAKKKRSFGSDEKTERVVDVSLLRRIFAERFRRAVGVIGAQGDRERAEALAEQNARLEQELAALRAAPAIEPEIAAKKSKKAAAEAPS